MKEGIYSKALTIKAQLPGWCSDDKTKALCDAVIDLQSSNYPPTIVEIGVFGGQSLVTLATATAMIGKGHVWGVDPWCAADDVSGYANSPENKEWWAKVDYDGLYRGLLQKLLDQALTHSCTLLRMPSRRAARLFDDESIDLLHIDGNHAPLSSTFDVVTWVPKVRSRGIVFFDDIDWEQTEMAYELAKTSCTLVREIGNCAILRRPT